MNSQVQGDITQAIDFSDSQKSEHELTRLRRENEALKSEIDSLKSRLKDKDEIIQLYKGKQWKLNEICIFF